MYWALEENMSPVISIIIDHFLDYVIYLLEGLLFVVVAFAFGLSITREYQFA